MSLDLAPELGAPPPADHPVLHWNPPEQLAPVGCWLLLQRDDGSTLHARRTRYLEYRNRDQEYELRDGRTLIGRFPWTPA